MAPCARGHGHSGTESKPLTTVAWRACCDLARSRVRMRQCGVYINTHAQRPHKLVRDITPITHRERDFPCEIAPT